MSLPSCAKFYDSNYIAIGEHSVNCGWVVEPYGITRSLDELVKHGIPETTKMVKMYGMEFPMELIFDMRGLTFTEALEVIEELYFNPHKTPKQHKGTK